MHLKVCASLQDGQRCKDNDSMYEGLWHVARLQQSCIAKTPWFELIKHEEKLATFYDLLKQGGSCKLCDHEGVRPGSRKQ